MKKIIFIIIGLALVGGVGFYSGIKYDQNKTMANRQARFTANVSGGFGNGQGRGVRNGNVTGGEVLTKNERSLTMKLHDGGSKIVLLGPSTMVSKSVPGVLEDVKIGAEVTAIGNTNQDGSVTAESIQIRPSRINK